MIMVELPKFEKEYQIRDGVFYTKVEVVESHFGSYLVKLQYRQKNSQKLESTKFPIYDTNDIDVNKLERKIIKYLNSLPVKTFDVSKQKINWKDQWGRPRAK